jgi:hypothetical protein
MRRSIHIVVTLAAIVALLQPFDCFSAGKLTQKTAECCKKGKCAPSSNSDDCCKGTLPGGKQLLASKAQHDLSPALSFAAIGPPLTMAQAFVTTGYVEVHAPPGSPPGSRLHLPLLI